MFIYVKKATINLVSTYNNKRRKIKVKFTVNESTLAWKLDLLISTFLTTFRTLENFIMQVYKKQTYSNAFFRYFGHKL